jgi:hypothetical protein
VRGDTEGAGGPDLHLGLLYHAGFRSAVEPETDGTCGTHVTYENWTAPIPHRRPCITLTRPSADTLTRSYGRPPKLA